MASTATAASNIHSASSGSNGNTGGSAAVPANAGGKSQLKANASNKVADANRRQPGSPMDGAPRHNPSQKAWTSTNPITQKPSNFAQVNGAPSQPRNAQQSRNASTMAKETNTPDKHANDRMLFLLANMIGLSMAVTTKTGDCFEGIFSGSSFEPNEFAFVLKMVKQTKNRQAKHVNGVSDATVEYIGTGHEHVMTFELKDIVHLVANGISLSESPTKSSNGSSSGFRTDADISGNLALRERTLQRWEPSTGPSADLSLEAPSSGRAQAPNASWDQFEENERKFGLKSDYDENLYTTTIDRSNPLYKQRAAAAEKIAREIESGGAMNAHMAEERGHSFGDDSGLDEEEKYSGVRRAAPSDSGLSTAQSNRYTPPARRPPTGQSTVPGAPVDPAIISSQIARPGSAKKQTQEKATTPAPSSEAEKTGINSSLEQQKPTAPDETTTAALSASKTTSSVKGLAEPHQRQSASGTSTGPSGSASPSSKKPGESATATVENDVRDAFKQFASHEKMRVQERRRNQAKQDKDIKLNDLMKFSQNFKLLTPVPKDLVSILAKDKSRQDQIVEKAQRNAEDLKSNGEPGVAGSAAPPADPRSSRATAFARYDAGPASSRGMQDRHAGARTQGHPPSGPQSPQHPRPSQPPNALPRRQGPGLLSERLANIQQQNKANADLAGIPSPVPVRETRPPTGPAAIATDLAANQKLTGTPTPSSATSTKFNVKALEFKPNPAAVSFTPTGDPSAASSPRSNPNARPSSNASTSSSFFGSRKPLPASERPSLNNYFNPIKRLRKEASENKEEWTSNGGIQPAHKTGPRWDVSEENKERTYTEMFDKVPFSTHSLSPAQPPHANPQLAHQHQLPFHLQQNGAGIAQAHTPHQPPHHLHPQQHHQHQQQQHHHHPAGYPHQFDDHRMHASTSSPSVIPSPRLQHMHLNYQSPMAQHAQLVYGPPMPQFGMGPGGPQVAQFGRYPPAPHMMSQQGSQTGAPMMAHNPSNGPFMGVPQGLGAPFNQQMHMYSPSQGHAYPQHSGPPPPPPGSSGYPSPGRGAPVMIHQGSQQGHPPQQMMMYTMSPSQHHQPVYAPQQPAQGHMRGGYPPPQQPQFGSSPHQSHHVPHHRGGPSGSYGHSGPPHPPHVASQQGPPPGPAQGRNSDVAEDAK
ncbi:MAG: hypothetical protein M1837_004807 [Sclerophora amabilis]|nr:MAG: hypothetical protein M1837_004807 [Sclerophora amabilis]